MIFICLLHFFPVLAVKSKLHQKRALSQCKRKDWETLLISAQVWPKDYIICWAPWASPGESKTPGNCLPPPPPIPLIPASLFPCSYPCGQGFSFSLQKSLPRTFRVCVHVNVVLHTSLNLDITHDAAFCATIWRKEEMFFPCISYQCQYVGHQAYWIFTRGSLILCSNEICFLAFL